jgi:hypothetical protein
MERDEDEDEDEEEDDEVDEDYAQAEQTISAKISPGTVKVYTAKMNSVKRYFMKKKNISDALDQDGNVRIPMTEKNLKLFMGSVGKERDDETCQTSSSVQGYVSALKWHYGVHNQKMSQECTEVLSSFSKGHKRKVAGLRQKGKMKKHEGKGHFSFAEYRLLCQQALELIKSGNQNNMNHFISFLFMYI